MTATAPGAADHIVDVLIAERAPRLTGSRVWPVLRPLFYRMLDYAKARSVADAVAHLSGRDSLDYVSRLLDLKVEVQFPERIPASGRCMVVINHPTGIADGIAAYDAIKPVRGDSIFFANADAIRVSPRLTETLIPVEWVEAKRTREKTRVTLQSAKEAFEAERAVIMFPAGRLARADATGELADPPWATTATSLARKFEAPICPIHMSGPWSTLFHAFNRISPELRDITLFHEFLNKQGREFRLVVGPLIAPTEINSDAAVATAALKTYVERELPKDPHKAFA